MSGIVFGPSASERTGERGGTREEDCLCEYYLKRQMPARVEEPVDWCECGIPPLHGLCFLSSFNFSSSENSEMSSALSICIPPYLSLGV